FRGLLVTWPGIGMVFLHQPPVRRLHGLEVGVAVELERVESAHFVAAAAPIPRASPLPVRGLTEARSIPLLLGCALRRFFRAQAREIIPVLVVFGSVGFAEI